MSMIKKGLQLGMLGAAVASLLGLAGCGGNHGDVAAQEAPPAAQVTQGPNPALITVDHPEQYPLVSATAYTTVGTLAVTGTVTADVARTVPVVTLASGRVVEVQARLGDTVQKGQVLLRVRSDDVGLGFDAYRKAVSDELLARKQLERTKDLYEHGAMAQQDLEIAQDAEDDAKTTLDTATEHLKLLGNDPDKPNGIVDILAPIAGVITDQEVTNASTVQSYGANPFTISDLSSVWIVCDVYENDLATVHMGDAAQIALNAFPNRVFAGRVSNVGAILDPSIRAAKVRIEVANPGMIMRIGMFATAIFRGQKQEARAQIPASAIMHLQDRDWVFEPTPDRKFRRVEIRGGAMLPNQMQEVISGLQPGQQVVTNAVVLENTFENQ
jgi:cobalt-zinc-cadmium efflux system membrane fusion protein